MRGDLRIRAMLALLAVLALAVGVASCGGGNDNNTSSGGGGSAQAIKKNPSNSKVSLTIGSKNFTEEFILGEIYAQGLEAAGYKIKTDLNLGDSEIALKALKSGDIDAYPDYTSTVLTSFFGLKPEDVPTDPQQAFESSKKDFAKEGLVAYPPTPYNSANAVGLLTKTADKLGLKDISDLKGKSQDLTLFGSPECRQRVDCLVGLDKGYGLKFKKFTPVDIGLRYTVLDKGQADLSILFTSDAQLATSKKYTILNDDKHVFPPGNPIFIATKKAADEAGPDLAKTVALVQKGMTLKVMQELIARVDIDKQKPADVAHAYLKDSGYID